MSSIDPRSFDIAVPGIEGAEGFEYLAAQRRNRLIGLWAGEKMGLSGESIETYARALDRGQSAEEDVIRKILGDLTASNIVVRESEVRVKAAEFLAQSREAIKAGA
jgi:hypothetical protein